MSRISGAHHQGDPSGGASGEGLPRGHRGEGQPRGVIVTVVFGGVVGRAGPEAGGAPERAAGAGPPGPRLKP